MTMLIMSGKSADELCGEWKKYRAIRDANEQMVRAVLDDINDALFTVDPQACFAFTKALGRDPDADPAESFGVTDAIDTPKRRRRA
jgi:hypothetical protein